MLQRYEYILLAASHMPGVDAATLCRDVLPNRVPAAVPLPL